MYFSSTVEMGEEVVKGKNEMWEYRLDNKNERVRLTKATYMLLIGFPQFNRFSDLLWQFFYLEFMDIEMTKFGHWPIELSYICHIQCL